MGLLVWQSSAVRVAIEWVLTMMDCERRVLVDRLRSLLEMIEAEADEHGVFGEDIYREGCAALPEAIREIEKNAA
jgi:hypothetical protein